MDSTERNLTFTDGSKLITEALVQAGADMFIGYPITPSNRFYEYGQKRFPFFFAAPDEISVLQWMSGAAAAGKIPVTATAFPGLALMVESINMAYVMELPMVIVVTQRLGPSTGSATVGAQGDLSLINGIIPGFPLITLCPSNFEDCWNLAANAVETAVRLRTPVILLTSKEMVMTSRRFDLNLLNEIRPVKKAAEDQNLEYKPYKNTPSLIPPFIPLGNDQHQVRFNASMHNQTGKIIKNEESLAVTKRLARKINLRASELSRFEYLKTNGAEKLIISYGVSALSVRDSYDNLRKNGENISVLIIKTLIPLSNEIFGIMNSYKFLYFVEENMNGQLKELVYGTIPNKRVRSINKMGSMITPSEITNKVL